jgi:hypothetical protein
MGKQFTHAQITTTNCRNVSLAQPLAYESMNSRYLTWWQFQKSHCCVNRFCWHPRFCSLTHLNSLSFLSKKEWISSNFPFDCIIHLSFMSNADPILWNFLVICYQLAKYISTRKWLTYLAAFTVRWIVSIWLIKHTCLVLYTIFPCHSTTRK